MATYSPNIYSSTSGQVNYAFTFESMEESHKKYCWWFMGTDFTITGYTTTGGGTKLFLHCTANVVGQRSKFIVILI